MGAIWFDTLRDYDASCSAGSLSYVYSTILKMSADSYSATKRTRLQDSDKTFLTERWRYPYNRQWRNDERIYSYALRMRR